MQNLWRYILKAIRYYSNVNSRTLRKHVESYIEERKNVDNEEKSYGSRKAFITKFSTEEITNCIEFVIFTRPLHGGILDFDAFEVFIKYLW